MTPTEVYELVRAQLTEIDPDFWTEQEIYNLLWNAEIVLTTEVGCCETTSLDDTIAATREYDRPANAIKISRVTYDRKKLKKITFTDVDSLEGDTEDDGEPDYYYEYGKFIGLVPTPTEIKTIKFYYSMIPTKLTNVSTEFTIPEEFSHYLADYALYFAYLKDQQNSTANIHLGLWQNNLRLAKDQWGSRNSLDSYPVVRVEENYPFTDLGIV